MRWLKKILLLKAPGTTFQQSAWKELQEIPYGKTISYKPLAITLGNPKAVRAIASTNGHNRISIIIPCRRIIGENGNLTGYGRRTSKKKMADRF